MSGDEVGVELDAERVHSVPKRPYLAYPGSTHTSLVVGVIAALYGSDDRLRTVDGRWNRNGRVGSRDCDEARRRHNEQSNSQAPNKGTTLHPRITANFHQGLLSPEKNTV